MDRDTSPESWKGLTFEHGRPQGQWTETSGVPTSTGPTTKLSTETKTEDPYREGEYDLVHKRNPPDAKCSTHGQPAGRSSRMRRIIDLEKSSPSTGNTPDGTWRANEV